MFEFYTLKFQNLDFTLLKLGGVWNSHSDISDPGFYPIKFESVSILYPKILKL